MYRSVKNLTDNSNRKLRDRFNILWKRRVVYLMKLIVNYNIYFEKIIT